MFGRGKKKKQMAQAKEIQPAESKRKKSLNGKFSIVGKMKKKKRKGRSTSEFGSTLVHPDAVPRNTDSDYDDSAVDMNDDDNRILDNDSDILEVYYDNDEDETTENRGIQSQDSNSIDEESTGEPSQPPPEPEPAVPVVSEDEKPAAAQAGLTKEERRARARKAIEERKKKSRLEIAARKAKAEGRPLPVATDTVVETERVQESMVVDHSATVDQEVRRRTVSEERIRLLELERQTEKEESEALQKEEEEMRELEKALKKEEEEARLQALKNEEEEEALKKEEEELKEIEEALRKKEEEAKSQTLEEEGETKELEEKFETNDGKDTVVVETVDIDELYEEEEQSRVEELAKVQAERVVTEELAKREAEPMMKEKAAELEAERTRAEELAKSEDERSSEEESAELEAERIREEELAKFEAEVAEKAIKLESQEEEERQKAEDEALRALGQFITQEESKDDYLGDGKEELKDDYVGDGNQNDISQEPDLDDILDGSLSHNESTILEHVMDGPIVFTPPSKPTGEKTKKEFTASRPESQSKVQKPSVSKYKKPPPPNVGVKPNKRRPVTKPRQSQPSSLGDESNKKRPVTKTKPNQGKTSSTAPNIVLRGISNMSHLRPQTNSITSKTRKPKIAETTSIDSMGSSCTVSSIPPSPFRKKYPNMPICTQTYIPKLHAKLGGCDVCVFKLSEVERELYEKNGRHLRVAMTQGGCRDCKIFPSLPGEPPVRLCKQCFFDTHLIQVRKEAAFGGTGALSGLNNHKSKYDASRHRFKGGR